MRHTHEYYSAIKRKGILPSATWTDLGVLCYVSNPGRERQIIDELTYLWHIEKKNTSTPTSQTQTTD